MTSKTEALMDITNIAKAHGITAEEVTAALTTPADEPVTQSSIAMKLFAYLGGIFILSGIMALVAMFWEDMNSAGRIIITLGSGFVLYVIALVADKDERYEKTITPMLLVSALLQPTGLFVAIDEFFDGGDWHLAAMFVFGVMLIQQGCTFWTTKRGVLLFTTIAFGASFVVTTFDWLEMNEELIGLGVGLSLLCISYSVSKTPYHVISGFWYIVGSISFLWALFDLVEGTMLEIIYLAVSCFLIYLSAAIRSRCLLTVSTLSLLFYIGYFTAEHFVDSVGWPIALIVLGFVFFGISSAVMKLKKKYMAG